MSLRGEAGDALERSSALDRAPGDALMNDLPPWVTRAMLAFLLVAGLVLTLVRLGDPGLWADEIYTARWTRLAAPQLIRALGIDLHPPLFFLLEGEVVKRVGESEAGVRLLAALATVATLAVSFWAFRPALGAKRALIASGLLALHPEFLLYGRMARYYSFAALMAMAAHGVFSRLMLARGRPRSWALYALSATLTLYTSYIAAAILVGHGAWAWSRRREGGEFHAWLACMGITLALFVPWLPMFRVQLATAHSLNPAIGAGPLAMAGSLAYGLWAACASERLMPWTLTGALAFACGVWLLISGLRSAWREKLGETLLVPAGIAGLVAWGMVVVLARGTPFVSLPARALFLLPFVTALFAVALTHRGPTRRLDTAAVVGICFAWMLFRVPGGEERVLNPIYRTPGREAAAFVASHATPGSLVLAEDDTGANWYLKKRGYLGAVTDPADSVATVRALAVHPTDILWVRLSRDGSARVRPAAAIRSALVGDWTPRDSTGFLRFDPIYRTLKRQALRLQGDEYRVTVVHWVAKTP